MAALCPGVQYGLSSQANFSENKDLIFVKLTDSAHRAIEEYLRNQNKFIQNPTIQFLGNEGQLSFPSDHGINGAASFNFTISSTADMEGPGGSFECVQQSPKGSLDVLGALPRKMRIHANDDVYEATRHRMTVAEENHKNKCTRVIKPNQTDIGRKVKVKQAPGRSVPIPKRETPPVRENSKPSYLSNVPAKPAPHANGVGNGVTTNYVSNSKPPNRTSDMMRRPIKERLIHLLALRPHKKLELYEKINRDGREKNVLTTVLKQIAYIKDNTYHLHQHMWNDVNDDWPYFTEQEKQLLKRRKPQNLTPPGSSDGGSSGSGQSPTSTHPGSPPPTVSTNKRPGYYDGADGLPTKRPRISRYRKPEPTYTRPVENNGQRRPVTDSRDSSNMNPRSREPFPECAPDKHSDEENDTSNRKRCDNQEPPFKETSICNSPSKSPNIEVSRSKESSVERIKQNVEEKRERVQEAEPEPEIERAKERIRWNKVSSTAQNGITVARVSPNCQRDRVNQPNATKFNMADSKSEFPDYLTEYTCIKNLEQRRRYKSDFNADYAEYRDLHSVVEKVSRRFAQLEERLKQEDQMSEEYKDIKKQIVRDYKDNQRDLEYQKAKRRFQYLHDKLSHIKRLVLEFDQSTNSLDNHCNRY